MNGKMIILACIIGFLLDCIFRRSGLDVPSDTRDRKPDQCVGKRIAEVVVQSDSCIRTKEEK